MVFSSRRRGAEVFASQLGDELIGRGHAISTISLEPRSDDYDLPFELLSTPGRGPRAIAELGRRARGHDVLIAHGGSTLLPVFAAAVLARRPFVYRNIGDPSYWGRTRAAQVRIGLPLRMAAQVIALYPGAAQYMNERYRIAHNRLTVAPNAVEVGRFAARTPSQRSAARAELGLGADQLVLGYLGNLSDEKRPDWAFKVLREIDTASLIIAGDGPLRTDLEQEARSLGSRGRAPACQLLGSVADPQRFLAAIDVLLLPSATEGIPGVLVEAALVGVPTVATDVGGVRNTMEAMNAGRCVAPNDFAGFVSAVRAVSSDPDSFLPDRSVAIERHAIERVADVWEDVLHRIGR